LNGVYFNPFVLLRRLQKQRDEERALQSEKNRAFLIQSKKKHKAERVAKAKREKELFETHLALQQSMLDRKKELQARLKQQRQQWLEGKKGKQENLKQNTDLTDRDKLEAGTESEECLVPSAQQEASVQQKQIEQLQREVRVEEEQTKSRGEEEQAEQLEKSSGVEEPKMEEMQPGPTFLTGDLQNDDPAQHEHTPEVGVEQGLGRNNYAGTEFQAAPEDTRETAVRVAEQGGVSGLPPTQLDPDADLNFEL